MIKILSTFSRRLIFVCASCVIAFSTFSVLYFLTLIENQELYLADENLDYTASSNAKTVNIEMQSYITSLKIISIVLQDYNDITSQEALNMLNNIAQHVDFEIICVDTLTGKTYFADTSVMETPFPNIVELISRDTPIVFDVMDSVIGTEPTISIAVPIHNSKKEPIALLRGCLKTTTLSNMFNQNLHNKTAYFYIIDSKGRYVAASRQAELALKNSNFFEDLLSMEFNTSQGYSAKDVLKAIAEKKPIHAKFTYNGQIMHTHISPIDIDGWSFMMIEPFAVIEDSYRENIWHTMYMVASIAIAFTVFTLYVFSLQHKIRLHAILDEKCFRALASHAKMAVVEWTYSISETCELNTYEELIEESTNEKKYCNRVFGPDMVHPDDAEIYSTLLNTMRCGNANSVSIRLRLRTESGEYIWVEHSCLTVMDEKGKPYKAIGFFENISDLVKKEESLTLRLQTDPLTGLLNKEAVCLLVEDALSFSAPHEIHALLCIDIDNFKNINDTFGHLFGDQVLVDIAAKIRSLFRSHDIMGRFGGDEFVVFIKAMPSLEFVREKAKMLCTHIHSTYSINEISQTVSASIGIALYPDHGLTYQSLYAQADAASYEAKRAGKNRYMLYDQGNPPK